MTVFIDSGIFVGALNPRDRRHSETAKALEATLRGRYGRAYTSDYVYDETVTLVRARSQSFQTASAAIDLILGRSTRPRAIDLLIVTGPIFRQAVEIFDTYDDKTLSFTDATSIAFLRHRKWDQILSFDSDFDGILPRVDPTAPG
ncbi:MAG: type II toxin-antitoxin system VapC family toxin [Thermoplasmatota archaeon]